MKYVALTLVAVACISGVAYYVIGHPNHGEVRRLERELSHLEAQNQQLDADNQQLTRDIDALRDDPRLAERRVRQRMGWAKPGELIIQFEAKPKATAVAVELKVAPDALVLAGKRIEVASLGTALARLRKQVPGAALEVRFSKEVDAIARQRVIDTVNTSPLAPARYHDGG